MLWLRRLCFSAGFDLYAIFFSLSKGMWVVHDGGELLHDSVTECTARSPLKWWCVSIPLGKSSDQGFELFFIGTCSSPDASPLEEM